MHLFFHPLDLWQSSLIVFRYVKRALVLAILAIGLAGCFGADEDTLPSCPAVEEPVCAVVEPEFCQLANCGFVEKTYGNMCLAQQSGASRITPGRCGFHSNENNQPIAYRRETEVEDPFDPQRMAALYNQLQGPAEIESTRVVVTNLGVTVIVTGTAPLGCQGMRLEQSVRLEDSFGVNLIKNGPDGCDGAPVAFEEYLVLDPGGNGWLRDYEYEIVINGKMGRFTI